MHARVGAAPTPRRQHYAAAPPPGLLQRNAAAVLDLSGEVQWETADVELGSPEVPAFQGTLRLPFKEQLPPCPGGGAGAPGGYPRPRE